jgi:hypothetical protein
MMMKSQALMTTTLASPDSRASLYPGPIWRGAAGDTTTGSDCRNGRFLVRKTQGCISKLRRRGKRRAIPEAPMKAVLPAAALVLAMLAPSAVLAGPIEDACNASDRRAASRPLCRCIDDVAHRMLTRSEQRRAARFFRNPDEAQRVRASRDPSDRDFWARYRAWGETAEAMCRPAS